MQYGLIGYPLGHSFSKEIHEAIGEYQYDLYPLKEEELDDFFSKSDFKGINVTIPYKQKVIKYLDEIDEDASKIGAINTIVNIDGKLKGYNTDFYGLLALIEKNDIEIEDKDVAILGTGGTSNTASYLCHYLKANSVIKISRSKKDNCLTYEQLNEQKDKFQVIINTTPMGMYPNNQDCLLDLSEFNKLEAVVDVIYNPLRTKLVLQAKEKGLKATNGLYMLVAQAIKAYSIFKNKEYDRELTDNIYKALLTKKENIVLIGMPTCGKTTLGNLLATRLNKEHYDIDDVIIKDTQRKITDIFSQDGEKVFREYEKQAVREVYKKDSVIISCGGGTILDKENVEMLKQNGTLVFLDRELSKLGFDDSRPITSSKEKLEKIYKERYEIYLQAKDITIENNDSKQSAIERILESYEDISH